MKRQILCVGCEVRFGAKTVGGADAFFMEIHSSRFHFENHCVLHHYSLS